MTISVIMPVLNEASGVTETLRPLQVMRQRGQEIILVDGGSTDDTCKLAAPLVDSMIRAPRGRARQMNAGAARATGDILWFLHADTQAPEDVDQWIQQAVHARKAAWGYCGVHLSGNQPLLRIVETSMNIRTRLTSIVTGDMGLFVTKALFQRVGGFANMPLMEDIELSKRLKQHSRPARLPVRLETSSRRWEENGILKTILLMWRLRFAWALGADPRKLAELYR